LPQHTTYGLHRTGGSGFVKVENFASAHHIRAASALPSSGTTRSKLCLSTPHTGCIGCRKAARNGRETLPQHTTYGLHPAQKAEAAQKATLCLSTPHTGCIISLSAIFPSRSALPQHTTYGLHHAVLDMRRRGRSFASAHHIRAASAKLRREMDTAL